MAERKDENLKELFENFVGPEQAKQAAEDIQRVEQMLEENPAPEPSEELQWQIKERICVALEKRRKVRSYWMPVYRAVAVAGEDRRGDGGRCRRVGRAVGRDARADVAEADR